MPTMARMTTSVGRTTRSSPRPHLKESTMADHHCHALGCNRQCPPRWLMCRPCWSKVPRELQDEVYRTVGLRGPHCDASWAPWWRAQAKAIAHGAFLTAPNVEKRDRYLAKEM